jgi:hypothetical protein
VDRQFWADSCIGCIARTICRKAEEHSAAASSQSSPSIQVLAQIADSMPCIGASHVYEPQVLGKFRQAIQTVVEAVANAEPLSSQRPPARHARKRPV